jgi:hypothetical protein
LLLEVAHRAGVDPTLRKDRITQVRSGWLLDAALVFESFLYPGMQSGSPEACGKRLERSKATLRRNARQNRSVR